MTNIYCAEFLAMKMSEITITALGFERKFGSRNQSKKVTQSLIFGSEFGGPLKKKFRSGFCDTPSPRLNTRAPEGGV